MPSFDAALKNGADKGGRQQAAKIVIQSFSNPSQHERKSGEVSGESRQSPKSVDGTVNHAFRIGKTTYPENWPEGPLLGFLYTAQKDS